LAESEAAVVADDMVEAEVVVEGVAAGLVEVIVGVFVSRFRAILSSVFSGGAGSELMVSILLMAPEEGSVSWLGADVTLRSWSIFAQIK
jgi:uncharacterized protein YfaQ (DUF2300 family)